MSRVVLLTALPLILTACQGSSPSARNEGLRPVSAQVRDQLSESQRRTLELPDAFEILALHPFPDGFDGRQAQGELLHEYEILGRRTLNTADRTNALKAVYDSISNSDGTVAACFNPRHGIAARRGSERIDLIICFECLTLIVRHNDQHHGSIPITQDARATLTQLLADAGIQIAR